MKIPSHVTHADQRGMTLLECLVYIAVLMVVAGIAIVGFNRCWDDNKYLRQNAGDITRALHAGEQWRADVRATTGDIRVTMAEDGETVVMPRASGSVTYHFSGGELQRQVGPGTVTTVVLDHIRSSQMQQDARQHVLAWRWELVLLPRQKEVHMKPLFTFESAQARRQP